MTIDFESAHNKDYGRVLNVADMHDTPHARLLEDVQGRDLLTRLQSEPKQERYSPKPEYSNGLASQNLIGLEKWVDDWKNCGAIPQDQLATKITDFAKKTDDMWNKMENDPKQFAQASKDQWLTYQRFTQVFDKLDEQHRDKVLETLPWTLRPGE
jgi:hypothetical protein